MRNYFYLYGTGDTARLFFVDAKRRAAVVAVGRLWAGFNDRAWYGVGNVPVLLPIHNCK